MVDGRGKAKRTTPMAEIVVLCLSVGLITVLVHQTGLLAIGALAGRFASAHLRLVMLGVVGGILALHVSEIGIYALAIGAAEHLFHLGRLIGDVDGSNLELLYFSAETFTSLGFGDILPTGQMRLLASFEPLNGLILIGWSASFIHLEINRYWRNSDL